jgi:S-adenosylmethionine synthetase
MNGRSYLFTSEAVTEGHPDKVCDQVSDAILDAALEQDPTSRVALETATTTGYLGVIGEMTTKANLDIPAIIRKTAKDIGYTDSVYGLDSDSCSVFTSIDKQSPDIAQGVNESEDHEQGAGDQGMMFGYATNETPELMPMAVLLSNKLCKKLSDVRKDGTLKYLGPDGKAQVTIQYEKGKPKRIDTVVVSTQHKEEATLEQIKEDITKEVINPICGDLTDENTTIHVNPTGRFVLGGPQADAGVTGRKIIVDTYGGMGRHGGGAFSGKDPSKVDRSGAYMGRYIAKNIVAADLADQCEVQVAYAIGVAKPVSVMVDTFGTNKISEEKIEKIVSKHFDCRPAKIIETLNLRRPIFQKTAAYGHFGREDSDFTWEKTDKAEELKQASGL